MSGSRLPAPAGAWVDRSQPLGFSFNGRPLQGLAGDSLASALLAAGVVHTGRSFKLHRPRGIVSCGVEEPSGLLDIGRGSSRTPVTRATDIDLSDGLCAETGNAWPSLGFDAAALGAGLAGLAGLLPAGFYYKTFLWPHWRLFEPAIRRAAGLGHAAPADSGRVLDRDDSVSRQVDTLVIGGGAAGLQAALGAARAGRQVLLMASAPHLGGAWCAQPALADRLAQLLLQVAAAGIEVVTRCTVTGLYDHQFAAAVQTLQGQRRERLWTLRARRIIVAAGAFERPMLFPDNDRPGVMLAGAAARYAARYGVACGQRVVIAAACDSAYRVARRLLEAGVAVVAIIDHRAQSSAAVPQGLAVYRASAIVAVRGGRWGRPVRAVCIAAHDGSHIIEVEADCIASAGGWAPAVHLHSMAGGSLRWDEDAALFVPTAPLPGIVSVGACAGTFDTDAALDHADRVGAGAADAAPVGGLGPVPADNLPSAAALASLRRAPGKIFVDLQNDVDASDVALAAREGYRSVEHLKRYTTLGMATDQGKTSNVNALVLMGAQTGRAPGQVGTTKFRPPFKPVKLNALAAGRSAERFAPLKRMPAHAWHAARGAAFEDFGGWLRPAAYLRAGETLAAAAAREALRVRSSVGLFEASPLGKIEVVGPDAAAFLDLMYVGTMSTIPVGGARYGLLAHETGVVFDDGIVARLGPQHFWINTTSGGVDRVAAAFNEWLQCEYVRHRVLVMPVTSNWGNVTVAGPQAWALLAAAGFDASLAPPAMKHMTLREVDHAGLPMRVLRASFCGELGYEINLPATATQALLDRLWALGRAFDAVPYGIEALMILRTEKAYLHLGADTDGTTLPGDIGMDRGVARKAANFVGRRSLLLPAARDQHRLQLVGLVPVDRRSPLPIGAQVIATLPPAAIDGYVTSSCYSPVLGHPVALAMLAGGLGRLGERVVVWNQGRSVEAEVAKTPFFDPLGERLQGDGCMVMADSAQPQALARTPMAGPDLPLPPATARLQVRFIEARQVLSLRHLPGGGTDAVLGLLAARGLPSLPAAGRCVGHDPLLVWRSPSECLLVACASDAAQTIPAALARLPGALAWGFNITAGSDLWALCGADADALLSRVVDAGALPARVGAGTRLRLADIAVVAWRQQADGVRILADRSHRHYLAAWFVHAAAAMDDPAGT